MQVTEVEFPIDTLTLRAKRWGQEGGMPVLALHGWLDNCASFDCLAPLLEDVDLVALDLAGHGQSDHRKTLNTYNIWSDIPEIIRVTQQLGWTQFALIGHSRGAMVSTLIAGAFPEKVTHLALIEGVLPHVNKPQDAPENLALAVKSSLKLAKRERHYYGSFSQAVEARANGFIEIPFEDAELLARRGVKADESGFYWASDPILRAPSEFKLTQAQVHAFMERIAIPIVLITGVNGLLEENQAVQEWIHSTRLLQCLNLAGGHHLHMSQGASSSAQFINQYFHGR